MLEETAGLAAAAEQALRRLTLSGAWQVFQVGAGKIAPPPAAWTQAVVLVEADGSRRDWPSMLAGWRVQARGWTSHVIALAADPSPRAVAAAYDGGACSVLRLPTDPAQREELLCQTLHYWCRLNLAAP